METVLVFLGNILLILAILIFLGMFAITLMYLIAGIIDIFKGLSGREYVEKYGECPICEDCPHNCTLDENAR